MQSLNQLTLIYIKWFSRLLGRIFFLCSAPVLASVALYIVNQACQILMVFVPLKLLIILGGDGLPSYVTTLLPGIDKNTLLINLTIAAGCILLTYLISEWAINKIAIRTGKKLVRSANKLSLFDDQEEFSKDVFTRVSRTLGGIAMFFGGLLLGFLLDWRIFAVLACVMILEYILLSQKWRSLQEPNKLLKRHQLIKNRQSILNLLGNVNFALTIAMLFWVFIAWNYNIFIAIIIIILSRQITTRFNIACADGFFIFQKQSRISALFFSDVQLAENKVEHRSSFMALLLPGEREKLLREIDQDSTVSIDSYTWNWCDSGVKNMVNLRGESKSNAVQREKNEDSETEIVLKLFPQTEQKHHLSDKLLLSELTRKHPLVPDFIESGEVAGSTYTLIGGPFEQRAPALAKDELQLKCIVGLWSYKPDETLADRILRSSKAEYEKLTADELDLLDVYFQFPSPELQRLRELLPEILGHLENLPKFINNKDLSNRNVRLAGEELKLLNWHMVSLEPLGFGLTLKRLKQYGNELLKQLRAHRDDCENIKLPSLMLASIVSEVGHLLMRQYYEVCAERMSTIIELAEECLAELKKNGS